MPQLEQAFAERFGKRLAVILAVPQLSQSSDYSGKIPGIAGLQFFQEVPHRETPRIRFVKLYGKFNKTPTSNLMLNTIE